MLRCPLPAMPFSSVSSPDSLRSYYLGSKVPQFRALGIPGSQNNANGGSSSITVVSSVAAASSGGGSTSSSLPQTVKTVSFTTSTLVPGHGQKMIVSLGTYKACQVLGFSAGSAARIEIYGTSTAQSTDFSRPLDTPPPAGTAQNIVTDVALDTAPFIWAFQNRVAANRDSPQVPQLYATVTNIGTGTQAITVTMTYVPLEI